MKFRLKDPGSAITHLIGFVLAAAAAAPLVVRADRESGIQNAIVQGIYICSMILLYAASTLYHSLDIGKNGNRRLKKLDHMMISVLIAGSYTPVCLIALHNRTGFLLCGGVWLLAVAGMVLKACWVTCPKWVSSVLYIGMGWMAVLAMRPIFAALPRPAFVWLLAGGILYTAGGVIYALKLPLFNAKHKGFGSHEIFHLFVMAGSACHFVVMYQYLTGMQM